MKYIIIILTIFISSCTEENQKSPNKILAIEIGDSKSNTLLKLNSIGFIDISANIQNEVQLKEYMYSKDDLDLMTIFKNKKLAELKLWDWSKINGRTYHPLVEHYQLNSIVFDNKSKLVNYTLIKIVNKGERVKTTPN